MSFNFTFCIRRKHWSSFQLFTRRLGFLTPGSWCGMELHHGIPRSDKVREWWIQNYLWDVLQVTYPYGPYYILYRDLWGCFYVGIPQKKNTSWESTGVAVFKGDFTNRGRNQAMPFPWSEKDFGQRVGSGKLEIHFNLFLLVELACNN